MQNKEHGNGKFTSETRNHISIIIEQLGTLFILLIGFAYSILSSNGTDIFTKRYWHELIKRASGSDGLAVILPLVALVIIAGMLTVSFLRWRKTFFYISGNDFIYEKRTLFAKKSKLPLSNIATVNIEQNIFERILSTAKVKLDLNSSQTADKTDFVFVLKHNDALALKEAIAERKSSSDSLQSEQGFGESVLSENHVSSGQEDIAFFGLAKSFLQSFLSFPFVELGITFAVIYALPLMLGEATKGAELIVLITFVGMLFRSVTGALNLSDYRLSADSKNFYMSFGLIKKRSYSFEKSKINAVIVRKPLLARLFGISFTQLAVVGLGNEQKENVYLSLVLPEKETNELLKKCVPEFIFEQEKHRAHKAQLVCALIKASIVSLLSLLLLFLPRGIYFCIAVFAVSFIAAVLSYKTKAFVCNENGIGITSGIFSVKTAYFRYGDIQTSAISSSPVARKMGASRLTVSILSSSNLKVHKSGLFEKSITENAASLAAQHSDNAAKALGS